MTAGTPPGPTPRRSVRIAVAGLGVVALMVVVGACTSSANRPNVPPSPEDSVQIPATRPTVMVGSYLHLEGMSSVQARELRHAQLGRNPRIVSSYYAWDDPIPSRFRSVPEGSIPMVSWRGTTYSSILNGSQDARIKADAHALAAYRKPVYLRFAWEMNGYWYDWGGPNNPTGANGYIAAWRHVHDIFVAAGATNVQWVWSINWNSNPDTKTNAGSLYYPGDKYVDVISVDGFSYAGQTPEDIFGAFYRMYVGRKPLMIAETAVSKPRHRPSAADAEAQWVESLAAWLKERPEVVALVWFDTNEGVSTRDKTDWRIDSNAPELAAFRKLVNDPYFTR